MPIDKIEKAEFAVHLAKYPANFIGYERFADWFGTTMPLYHCAFRQELYHDRLYAAFGINFPQSLENSVVKRRAEFLAGRYCATRSLLKLGINCATIGTGNHRSPLWPEDIVGSISHSGSHAIAITGRGSKVLGVGIDIEDIVDMGTADSIQHYIVNKDEIPLFSRNEAGKQLLFTLAFSVKESFFKAAYPTVGKYFVFDAVSLVEIDRRSRAISLRINNTLHEKLTEGMLINGTFHILSEGKVVTLVILEH